MLSRHAGSCAIRPAENHGTAHLAARHIICFGRRVNDMIDRLHGEVEGHEFDDRPQATHRRAGPKARKTIFSDWGFDDSLRPELLEQALMPLISPLIFGDLLTPYKQRVLDRSRMNKRPQRK